MTTAPVTAVHVRLTPAERDAALRAEVRAGLAAPPRELQPKWLYDPVGCALFDEITRLDEYYPTRTERGILRRRAAEIARLVPADTVIELGSGSSDKTRIVLDAVRPDRFVPFDVSEEALRDSAAMLRDAYPGMSVEGVVGDFESHLEGLPRGGRRLLAFLGGTIGNLPPDRRALFLADVAEALRPGDAFLLGADLVKDPARLVAAYDDAAGVTARFDLNALTVVNRELDGDFDVTGFRHEARWDAGNEWIEMLLRSTRHQTVRLRALDMTLTIAAGETIRTEISAKFRRAGLTAELAGAGLDLVRWWTDPDGDFALILARPRGSRP